MDRAGLDRVVDHRQRAEPVERVLEGRGLAVGRVLAADVERPAGRVQRVLGGRLRVEADEQLLVGAIADRARHPQRRRIAGGDDVVRLEPQELERLAARVGIADKLNVYPQELSLGLARRVAIARAFATKPDLLLLDEPFVSLDERTADRLRRLLLEVWSAQPTTAILVTHNPREAILLADQLVLLAPRPTHVIATVPIDVPQEKRDHDAIERIYADLLKRYPANFATG